MRMELDSLYEWLSKTYHEQLGLILANDENLSEDSRPIALWQSEGKGGVDCAELLDRDLGAWLHFRVFDEKIGKETLERLVDGDVRWGLQQLASLSPSMRAGEKDQFGSWQIHLIWLVPQSQQSTWRKKMQAIRAESGFSEELGLDGIFIDGQVELAATFEAHRMPQLLFSSRRLLNLPVDKMPQWLKANEIFSESLKKLPSQVDALDKQRAEQLVDELLGKFQSESSPLATTAVSPVTQYTKISVRNFRNIEEATLQFPNHDVVVVHGPNGSGKSSLFEALALGVTGSSNILKNYLHRNEIDLLPTEKRCYVENVLANRRAQQGVSPSVMLNDQPCAFETLASAAEEASEWIRAADGNLLAQEDARTFVEESGTDLGSRILRGYSELADKTQDYVDAQYNQSNQRYKTWLSEYGLNSGITLASTRFAKLARKLLGDHVPPGGQGIASWLGALKLRFPEAIEQVNAADLRWQRIDSQAGRDELAEKMASAEKLGFGVEVLENWLKARLASLEEIDLLYRSFESRILNLTSQLDGIQDDLKSWAAWKIRQSHTQVSQTVPVSQNDLATDRIALLERELVDLTRKGQDLNLQAEHLSTVMREILPKWQKSHPTECPTCKANHADGIEHVVAGLHTGVQEQVEALRSAYRDKQNEIKQLRLQQSIFDKCPLSVERQKQLADLLNVPVDGPQGLEALISQPRGDELIMQSITLLAIRPKLQDLIRAAEPAKEEAGRVFESISKAAAEGEALRTTPDSWGRLKKMIDSIAAELVRQHLPNTLEAVWQEIAFGLTPARWNLWGQPRLVPTLARGAQKLTVVIEPSKDIPNGKNLLARYAFNQAEKHILGLAWFFTRYLSHGRYQHSLIALDDPAQEMDQTTYRVFVRWIQALSRLHISREIPLSTVIFLHQEDRALDLARATSLSVVMIEWASQMRTHGPNATVKTLQLNNSEYKWPLPAPLRSAASQVGFQVS